MSDDMHLIMRKDRSYVVSEEKLPNNQTDFANYCAFSVNAKIHQFLNGSLTESESDELMKELRNRINSAEVQAEVQNEAKISALVYSNFISFSENKAPSSDPVKFARKHACLPGQLLVNTERELNNKDLYLVYSDGHVSGWMAEYI